MTAERDSMTLQEMGAPALGVEERGKHERAPAPRLTSKNAPGLSVERNPSRPRLAVREDQHAGMDFRPAQLHDLAPAASCQE